MENKTGSPLEILIQAIRRRDINSAEIQKLYGIVHDEALAGDDSDRESLAYRYHRVISKYSYEELAALLSPAISVSLTSYPARIRGVTETLKTIFSQTVQPNNIRLCLVTTDFPDREADLPTELTAFRDAGKITIRWCDFDLKPHNKYFHTMLDCPDDIVITVDDDLYYDRDMIEKLYLSYLEFPGAVSANRTHLITFDRQGRFEPYMDWLIQQEIIVNRPAMQLLPTGVSGVLYPPHLLGQGLFNRDVIEKTCIYADDLWLKAIEIHADIPTVQTARFCTMKIVPESQQNALSIENITGKRNDRITANIKDYFDSLYGENYLENKIRKSMEGMSFTIDDLVAYTRGIRTQHQNEIDMIYQAQSWKIGQAVVNPIHNAKAFLDRIKGAK